jgi:hypothetical protein
MKTLDRIARDPRVLSVESEAGVADSRFTYTLTLARGWQVDGAHYPCENSVRELLATFKRIVPCHCAECNSPD